MALIKEGLWKIVEGTEVAQSQPTFAKFMSHRDRALAIVVLSVEPSLLLFDRRTGGSWTSLEKAKRPVYEKDMGEQA